MFSHKVHFYDAHNVSGGGGVLLDCIQFRSVSYIPLNVMYSSSVSPTIVLKMKRPLPPWKSDKML